MALPNTASDIRTTFTSYELEMVQSFLNERTYSDGITERGIFTADPNTSGNIDMGQLYDEYARYRIWADVRNTNWFNTWGYTGWHPGNAHSWEQDSMIKRRKQMHGWLSNQDFEIEASRRLNVLQFLEQYASLEDKTYWGERQLDTLFNRVAQSAGGYIPAGVTPAVARSSYPNMRISLGAVALTADHIRQGINAFSEGQKRTFIDTRKGYCFVHSSIWERLYLQATKRDYNGVQDLAVVFDTNTGKLYVHNLEMVRTDINARDVVIDQTTPYKSFGTNNTAHTAPTTWYSTYIAFPGTGIYRRTLLQAEWKKTEAKAAGTAGAPAGGQRPGWQLEIEWAELLDVPLPRNGDDRMAAVVLDSQS